MRVAIIVCFGFVALPLSGCEILADAGVGEVFSGGGPEIVWMNDSNAAPYDNQDKR